MMRKSPFGYSIPLLIITGLCLFALLFYQKAWLIVIQYMLSRPGSGLPTTSSTPIVGFSISTAPGPVSIGSESIVGNVGITVTNVLFPANSYVGNAANYTALDNDEDYLRVDIKVRCVSSKETCRLTEFDFGVEANGGQDYPVELSGGFDLKGLFEGGEIEPGKRLSGSLIFVIKKGESGLVLYYPRLFGFGGTAKFKLTK